MAGTKVVFRDPSPPFAANAVVSPVDLDYGWKLGSPATASFQISRDDNNIVDRPGVFDFGQMVTIERPDHQLPWVGIVQTARKSLGDPVVRFTATDHAGAYYARARTSTDGQVRVGSAGEIVRGLFVEADARARPPLMTRLPASLGGPIATYTPKGESILSFLRRFGTTCGCEWAVRPTSPVGHVELVWDSLIGHDLSAAVRFEEGVAFVDADLHQDLEGEIEEAVYVGGAGAFSDRMVATAQRPGAPNRRTTSPAFHGTRVVVEPVVTSLTALAEGARAAFRSVEYVRERLTLKLLETNISVGQLSLGSRYAVQFQNLDLGLGYKRVIRAVGIGLGLGGTIDLVAETWSD